MSYTSDNKRIAKNTLFLYTRMLLIMFVSLYTIRIVVKTLGVTDYGIYTAVGGVVFALSFLSQTITSASQRFFSYELGRKDFKKLKRTFSAIFIVYLGISIVILLLAETIGLWFLNNKMTIPEDRMDAVQWVYQFSLFSFIITVLTSPYNALIIARENMKIYAYISVIEVVLKLIIVYFLLLFSMDKLKLYVLLTFSVTCIVCAIYIVFSRSKYEESKLSFSWDKELFKSVFSYSSWTMFGTVAGVANNQGVNILLNIFFGPIANAAYSVGSQVGLALQRFSGNFFTAIRPPLIKSYAENNYEYTLKLFYLSSKISFSLLLIIVLPLVLEIEYILYIWLGNVGAYMVVFTRFILIYTMLVSLSNPITTIVQAAKKVKIYHGVVDGFVLLILPLTYLFFKLGFSSSVTFIISISIFFFAHMLRVFILKKIIDISIRKYAYNFILPSLCIMTLSIIPSLFIHSFFDFGLKRFLVVVFFSITIIVILTVFMGFNKVDRGVLFDFIKKIIN